MSDTSRRGLLKMIGAAPLAAGLTIRQAEATGRMQRLPGTSVSYDPVSNLHVDHIRSGRSGEWRTVFTRVEVAMIEDRTKEWLVANKYALSLSPWQRVMLKLWYSRRPRRRQRAGAPRRET
jgi:hypothetical protein